MKTAHKQDKKIASFYQMTFLKKVLTLNVRMDSSVQYPYAIPSENGSGIRTHTIELLFYPDWTILIAQE